MTNKTRDRLTTVMDIAVAGLLALVPVAVVGSWWVGAAVFGVGMMWVLRAKDSRGIPGFEMMTPEEVNEHYSDNPWDEFWEYEHYYGPSSPSTHDDDQPSR